MCIRDRDKAICEDSPYTIKEGGVIKEGYSEELDNIKFSIKDGKQWIANLENAERERTGIRNLKVGFNKVFGYYIDVTKSNIDLVPDDYIRKQTLVNKDVYKRQGYLGFIINDKFLLLSESQRSLCSLFQSLTLQELTRR